MKDIFSQHARKIKIVISKYSELDPYEKNREETPIMYLPLEAIVSDLTTTKAQYSLIGITTDKAKELTIRRKDKPKLELSSQILIDGEVFIGWRSGTKLQFRETDDREFVRIYCYIKKTS